MGSRGYKIDNQNGIYFITFAVVEWMDVFTREGYKQVLIDSLKYCQKEKGLNIHSWVIMTNHVHFILSAKEGYGLSNILRDFKKHTAVEVIDAIKSNLYESRKDWMLEIFRQAGKSNSRNAVYQFWRQDNQPKELTDNKMIEQKLDYIHNNPVKEGIVENAEEYKYSSAKDYAGMKGLLEIEFLN